VLRNVCELDGKNVAINIDPANFENKSNDAGETLIGLLEAYGIRENV
jgi:hypothetical protein